MCKNQNENYVYNQLSKKEIDYLIKNRGYTCLNIPHKRFFKTVKVMISDKQIRII